MKDCPRILDTMLRVLNLEKSLNFYSNHLGMKLLRKHDYPEGRFTLAFLGFGDESNDTVIELTHNWDRIEPYAMGEAFGHIAIGVSDIYALCETLEKNGVDVPRKPGPMKHGTTILAFARDSDGYMVEFIER